MLTRFDEQDTEILIAADKIDEFAREASDLVARARGDLTPDLRALTVAARGLNLEKDEPGRGAPAAFLVTIAKPAERWFVRQLLQLLPLRGPYPDRRRCRCPGPDAVDQSRC
ncbi:hypothetical protein G5V59_19040 [Nocardioides sp. W3-2-3]|uniref:hypothetical protein n=1 Tax=Nocardioides convexus TaxID=2712224 RepID=UPI0024186BCB|nr:hypothetical protein [Nocardioides convexus]NHA01240.1 hypothetical protein [Nocardioides convexus]